MMGNFVNSFLSIYDQNGKLPIWPLQSGETECMPGYSSIPIIADCYLKGIGGFDAERALKDMVASATYDKQNGVTYVKTMGYIPADKIHEATSIAMEYAADDWGLAEMAKKMGKEDIYKTFIARGHYYEKYFDKSIRFVRPKLADGSWRTPYDPFNSIHSVGDFTEGTGWQYTFFVPQHPEGLISILGGDARFISKLDSLFIVHGDMGKQASNDISGLIGQYAHGNEPSHHVAYLYPYAGAQWKTAKIVRQIQKDFYTDQPDGIIGNEDCGQMSAWHILSALGFYQVNPSNGVFVFGSPLFDKASVNVGNGKRFEVIAKNNSPKNIYIQSVMLNGKPYENAWISYQDIMKGGTLTFTMGDQPNKSFGAAPQNRPKTLE
jgi:predicted alpha-1,2-mannosidase